MPDLLVIANPAAGRGLGRRMIPRAARLLAELGLEHDLRVTAAAGEAREIARREAGRYAIVAVLGGDGTLQEVAGGLIEARRAVALPTAAGAGEAEGCDQPPALAILPAGTGNDLIKSIGIPAKLEDACAVLRRGCRRRLDLGRIRWRAKGDAAPRERIVVNNVGLGFEGQVGWEAARLKLPLRGAALYLLALARVLKDLASPPMTITLGSGESWRGPTLLVSAGIGGVSGGGFRLNPQADPFDGLLDICVADARGRLEVLRLIPRALRGTHVGLPGIRNLRDTQLEIASDMPVHAHADGELLGDRLVWARIEILPGAIPLVC